MFSLTYQKEQGPGCLEELYACVGLLQRGKENLAHRQSSPERQGPMLTMVQKCQWTQPSGKDRTVGPCHLQDPNSNHLMKKEENNPLSYTGTQGLNQSGQPKIIFSYLEEFAELCEIKLGIEKHDVAYTQQIFFTE